MATLTDPIRRFIVVSIARYERPTAVAEAVKEHFGIEVDRSQVAHYDPTGVKGREVGKKWRVLFHEERERINRELDDIPIYHRGFRLRELQKLYDRQERNPVFQRETLIEAEKITGDLYTNRQRLEHTGKDGGPIETQELTDADLVERARTQANRLAALTGQKNGKRSGRKNGNGTGRGA